MACSDDAENPLVFFLTGAGASVASGLRPYRGPGGVWEEERVADVGTATAFARDPAACAAYWGRMARAIAVAAPNAGHIAIAELESKARVVVATQNVDGLHQRAGSTDVLELHGSARRWRCSGCTECGDQLLKDFARCQCGGWQRPDVVAFEEALPSAPLCRARQLAAACDYFVCVGTSLLVRPAADIPRIAAAGRALTIFVGTEEPQDKDAWHQIFAGASEVVLPCILGALLDKT